MCLQDVKIGEKALPGVSTVAIGASATQIFARSQDRYSFVIGPPANGTLTVWPDSGMSAGVGIILTSASAPLMMNLKDNGYVVRLAWFGIHSVGGVSIGRIETQFNVDSFEKSEYK